MEQKELLMVRKYNQTINSLRYFTLTVKDNQLLGTARLKIRQLQNACVCSLGFSQTDGLGMYNTRWKERGGGRERVGRGDCQFILAITSSTE